ncbi:SDR family NAD(P)-dependent oxidoreductase [Chloroflexota bacterium]
MRLKDKVAVITGAGSGIGKATAKLFAKEGARVVAADISENAGQEVVQQIKQEGGETTFVRVDVSSAVDVQRMVQTAINSYGRLDILFNNAGVAGVPFDEETEEEWRRVIDINLTGPFLGCMYAVPEMKKQGGGNIINTGSVAGLSGSSRSTAYAASKAGVVLLSRVLARSFAKDNIRVNCICPGPIKTPLAEYFLGYPKTEEERQKKLATVAALVPLGRVGKPEEIASLVLFLASDESSFVNGAALVADGGALA